MKPQLSTHNLPKVIFLDAMGTLFDLKSSVGEIYQEYALKYDVKVDAKLLNKAFFSSFKSAPPLAFSTTKLELLQKQEFSWWNNIVQTTFSQIGMLETFTDFTDFFQEIYSYFATKEPWYIFPDVVLALERWQEQGIKLGVISNFDTRLNEVLKLLELDRFFSSITISSVAGFAKPDINIFEIALKKHHVLATESWHIGDSIVEDYEGGKNAGISSFWLNRQATSLNIENQLPNLSSLG